MLLIFKWFGLLASVICIIGADKVKKSDDDSKEDARCLVKMAIGFIILFIVCNLGLKAINMLSYEETVQTGEYNYIYVADGKIHYKSQINVSMKKDINDENVLVIEEPDGVFRMIEYTVYIRNKMDDNWRLLLTLNPFDKIEKRYELYVPEGYLKETT